LTCITCQVRFSDADLHRSHFKGDWHRYNLKRKVAQLPIVSADAFEQRKVAHENEAKIAEKNSEKNNNDYCVACGKNFKNPKAYNNHIQSKKHQEMILKFDKQPPNIYPDSEDEEMEDEDVDDDDDDDEDLEIEEVDSDEWEEDEEEYDIRECLFSGFVSSSLEENLRRMTIKYSFFLPDPEYITDLEGLIRYLGAKVTQGYMCLWCGERGKRFSSKADVRRHMLDKGHCKMRTDAESMLEYDEWYDYTSSYPDQENPDEDVDLDSLDDTGYELVLPSGTKVGHRSLMRYYKQSLNPNRSVVLVDKSRHNLMSTYRSLGWTGTSGQEAVTRARDLGFMRRITNKHNLKLGMKSNHQKHFKDRNGMCM